jgi:hypothetical protein
MSSPYFAMKYIGACALLARLSSGVHDEETQSCIGRALADCAEEFPGRFQVVAGQRGWALEPIFDPNNEEKGNG